MVFGAANWILPGYAHRFRAACRAASRGLEKVSDIHIKTNIGA